MGQGFHGRMGPPKTFIWILLFALRFVKGAEGGIFTFLDHKMSREEKKQTSPLSTSKSVKPTKIWKNFKKSPPPTAKFLDGAFYLYYNPV
ncbi:MAG: hypothetical protein IJD43_09240 [Thermoguttaceae bacterium]|nr:hypothetical protein [Thermoguttaceae bacterium]